MIVLEKKMLYVGTVVDLFFRFPQNWVYFFVNQSLCKIAINGYA